MAMKDPAFHPWRRQSKGFASAFARRCEFVCAAMFRSARFFRAGSIPPPLPAPCESFCPQPDSARFAHRSMTSNLMKLRSPGRSPRISIPIIMKFIFRRENCCRSSKISSITTTNRLPMFPCFRLSPFAAPLARIAR